MYRSSLLRPIVEDARERAWQGEGVKAIAADLGVAYQPLWNAVRGNTFAWLKDPPPMPVGAAPLVKPPARLCNNPLCRQEIKRGYGRYCQACIAFRHRNGRERNPAKDGVGKAIRKHIPDLPKLISRYRAGESFESLADGREFSPETLRRRFKERGIACRNEAGGSSVLTAGQVQQARELVYRDGWRIYEVATYQGVNYRTLWCAVRGNTWRNAGGPLPKSEARRPCQVCGLLTDQGVCGFCRAEKKEIA